MRNGGILFMVGVLGLAGCASIGPGTVNRDRFDYTAAISDSWKRQMLLNIVKVRYADAPVFMDVSSVITQYAIEGAITLGATMAHNPFSNFETLGGSARYTDRPTITYNPVGGEKFARSLMTPIPPPAILSLIQAGYPVHYVFRLLVHEINGIQNRYSGEVLAREADPEFDILMDKLRKIQSSGAIGMRVRKVNREEAAVLIFRGKRDEKTDALVQEVRKILGLDPEADEFRVVYGSFAKDDKEIAILTRSTLEIITDLGGDIEVPPIHVEEKRVSPSFEAKTPAGEKIKPLMRVQSSVEKPADAFVSVRYRDCYFWIDDRDIIAKRVFSFLMFIFTLVETGEKGAAPIVTIPTG